MIDGNSLKLNCWVTALKFRDKGRCQTMSNILSFKFEFKFFSKVESILHLWGSWHSPGSRHSSNWLGINDHLYNTYSNKTHMLKLFSTFMHSFLNSSVKYL